MISIIKRKVLGYNWKYLWKQLKRTKYLQLMLILPIVHYIIFSYIPMYGITIAFKNFNLRMGILDSPWVGFKHFLRFFEYPHFWRLVRNTVLINVYNLIFYFPLPIIFAILLNELRSAFFKKAVQTISYLPHFISSAAIVGMMYMIFSPTTGIANKIIGFFGGESIYFMIESSWFRTLFIGSGIWAGLGWSAIIYIAALSGVAPEIYEAATIDGAGRFQRIRYISIPSIMPTIVILFIMEIGGMMSVGIDKILLMQQPVTFDVSDVIGTFVYRMGLEQADYSFGTSVGLFNAIINLTLLFIANSIARRVSEHSLF